MIVRIEKAIFPTTQPWEGETIAIQESRRGYFKIDPVSMSNAPTFTIKSGSAIDVDGILYIFDQDEVINPPSNGNRWMVLNTSGATPTIEFVTTKPTYDAFRKGYYSNNQTRGILATTVTGGTFTNNRLLDKDYDVGRLKTETIVVYDQADLNALNVTGTTNISGAATLSGVNELSGTTNISGATTLSNTVQFTGVSRTFGGTTNTFNTPTNNFNGSIFDKNGNEVLAMRAQHIRQTQTGTSANNVGVTITRTLTFGSTVQGVALAEVAGYNDTQNLPILNGNCFITNLTISGSTVSVTATAHHATNGNSITITFMVTALRN